MKPYLQKDDALLVVDPQIDFFPQGALGVPNSHSIIPVINEWLELAKQHNMPIFVSRDWHPANHCSFKQNGGIWPTHCVQNTPGADFHPDINFPPNIIIINKATKPNHEAYSALHGTLHGSSILLAETLKQRQVKRIWLLGLALDYCVVESALEARLNGFEVNVLLKGTQSLTTATGNQAIERMRKAGVHIEL